MNYLYNFTAISALSLSVVTLDVCAADNLAPVVLLQKTCDDGAGGMLNNCFTTTEGLVSWIMGTRLPNVGNPLVVKMGSGTYSAMKLTCAPTTGFTGHIRFLGSGREETIIRAEWDEAQMANPAVIRNCTNLSFSNLKFNTVGYGWISWNGGGSSVWENVDVAGGGWGWLDSNCGTSPGSHYWYNSRISGSLFGKAEAYEARCDQSWFFGSELVSHTFGPTLKVIGTGKLYVYGSNLRADMTVGSGGTSDVLLALVSGSTAELHIHGTGIDASATDGRKVKVLSARLGGTIHADVSAYNLKSGEGGEVIRIDNVGGHIHAPYVWQHIPNPASIPNFTSADGADQAMVIASDGYPHTAIYSTKCKTISSNAAWYDIVDKVCRGPQ